MIDEIVTIIALVLLFAILHDLIRLVLRSIPARRRAKQLEHE